jgi:hypothetical protein
MIFSFCSTLMPPINQSIDNGAKVYAAHEVHAWLMQMALQSNTTDRPNPCDPPKSPSI